MSKAQNGCSGLVMEEWAMFETVKNILVSLTEEAGTRAQPPWPLRFPWQRRLMRT